MKVKEFNDKYDKEFVNLLLEINKRTSDFCKSDKLKINSWVKALCLPTTNIPWKKNRNLYSILLLDSVLKGKLEPPFNKFLHESDELEMLSPSVVKSTISSRFIKEISFNNSDEQIQNFINSNFYQSPEKLNNKTQRINNNIPKNNYKNANNNLINYYSNKTILPSKKNIYNNNINNYKNKRSITAPQKVNNVTNKNIYQHIYDPNIKKLNSKNDILLNAKYFGIKDKLKYEKGFQTKTSIANNKKLIRMKLKTIIQYLHGEQIMKNQIISQQGEDIQELRTKISRLERKIKSIINI